MEHDPHQLIEGCAICCCARRRQHAATSTSAASTPRPPRSSSGRIDEAYDEGHPRQEHARLGLQARHVRPPRRRRLHLRRGDRPARVARGQARLAAHQAAVPRRRRRLRRADGRSTTSRRSAACRTSSSAAPSGSRRSAPTSRTPARSSTASPATSSARASTSADRHHLPASCSTRCGGMLKGGASSRPSSPAAPRRRCCSRRTRSTSSSTSTRVAKAGSMLGSAAVIVMDEHTCMVRAVAQPGQVLQPRVLRPVHALPRGHELDGAAAQAHRARRGDASATRDLLSQSAKHIGGNSLCALGDAAIGPVAVAGREVPRRDRRSTSREHGRCPFPARRRATSVLQTEPETKCPTSRSTTAPSRCRPAPT